MDVNKSTGIIKNSFFIKHKKQLVLKLPLKELQYVRSKCSLKHYVFIIICSRHQPFPSTIIGLDLGLQWNSIGTALCSFFHENYMALVELY